MKHLLLALISIGFITPAFADVKGLNEKTDELELEQEVNDVEQYGESAAAEEALKESARLQAETRSLERDIEKLNRLNQKAKEKTQALAEIYNRKAQLAARVKAEADKAEIRKVKSEKDVARLSDKVKAKNDKVIAALNSRKAAEQRVAKLAKEKRSLESRLAKAEKIIKANERMRLQLRAQSQRMAKNNAKLGHRVGRTERRAGYSFVR